MQAARTSSQLLLKFSYCDAVTTPSLNCITWKLVGKEVLYCPWWWREKCHLSCCCHTSMAVLELIHTLLTCMDNNANGSLL